MTRMTYSGPFQFRHLCYYQTSTFQPFIIVASLRVVSSHITQYGKMSASTDRRDIVIVGMNFAPHVTYFTPHSQWWLY